MRLDELQNRQYKIWIYWEYLACSCNSTPRAFPLGTLPQKPKILKRAEDCVGYEEDRQSSA